MTTNRVSADQSCFVIAEAGVNHNGDRRLALELIDAAAQAGADAVKFQSFRADKLVRTGTPTTTYQKDNSGETDQLAMLRKLELTPAVFRELAARCLEKGIEFMSTPFDQESLELLLDLGMRRIKIPSGELTNHPFLTQLAGTGRPLILSTGMATIEEVSEAVSAIAESLPPQMSADRLANALTLLHCTSNYPTSPGDVNLRAILTLRERFGLPTGFSDHTNGIIASVAATAMGATVIEKHFTLSQALPGPDHPMSLEPAEFAEMIASIRLVNRMSGDGVKAPRKSELAVRDLVRRSVVAARDIPADCIVGTADFTFLRPGTGLAPRELSAIVGRRTRQLIAKGTLVGWDQFI